MLIETLKVLLTKYIVNALRTVRCKRKNLLITLTLPQKPKHQKRAPPLLPTCMFTRNQHKDSLVFGRCPHLDSYTLWMSPIMIKNFKFILTCFIKLFKRKSVICSNLKSQTIWKNQLQLSLWLYSCKKEIFYLTKLDKLYKVATLCWHHFNGR